MKKALLRHIRQKELIAHTDDLHRMYQNRMQKISCILIAILLCTLYNVVVVKVLAGNTLAQMPFVSVVIRESIQGFFGLMIIVLFFVHPYPPSDYGFRIARLKDTLLGTVLLATLFGSAAFFVRMEMIRQGQHFMGLHFTPVNVFSFFVGYPLIVLIQETAVRGIIQSAFMALFEHLPYRRAFAILSASLVFAQFHVPYGAVVTVASFGFSIVQGIFYERSRSLLGVWLVHFVFGTVFFGFADIF